MNRKRNITASSPVNIQIQKLSAYHDVLLFVIVQLGLCFPLLLQGGSDCLVLPANLMGKAAKESKLQTDPKYTLRLAILSNETPYILEVYSNYNQVPCVLASSARSSGQQGPPYASSVREICVNVFQQEPRVM